MTIKEIINQEYNRTRENYFLVSAGLWTLGTIATITGAVATLVPVARSIQSAIRDIVLSAWPKWNTERRKVIGALETVEAEAEGFFARLNEMAAYLPKEWQINSNFAPLVVSSLAILEEIKAIKKKAKSRKFTVKDFKRLQALSRSLSKRLGELRSRMVAIKVEANSKKKMLKKARGKSKLINV